MDLHQRVEELEQENAALRRYIEELRSAINVLMQPPIDATPTAVSEMKWPPLKH